MQVTTFLNFNIVNTLKKSSFLLTIYRFNCEILIFVFDNLKCSLIYDLQ